jgi:hypothetical protein
MAVSLLHFREVVADIQHNSWWNASFSQRRLTPLQFTYTFDREGERITEVPKEPFESLLLRVRRLTMSDSAENLHLVRKELKRIATDRRNQEWLDAWHKYWRLSFIKEPYLLDRNGSSQVMTGYKVYQTFINGHHFHSNVGEYNIILYGADRPAQIRNPNLFLQNQFHATVANLCFAALGLGLYMDNGCTFENVVLTGHVIGITDFLWCRNLRQELDQQYKVFNDWIEKHGGCCNCHWK